MLRAERAVRAYADDVFRLAYHQLLNRDKAEDVTQEVFLSLLTARTCFEDERHLKGWLMKATINRCKNARRFAARHPEECADPQDAGFFDARLPSQGEEGEAQDGEIWECVACLPEELRTVLCLYYVEGYKVKEIAQITDASPSTVRTRLHRARKKLGSLLGGV
ncbi:MAG: sigma-70 family RNA polymerase sigma factor [Eggerthellaceae bacterium]|nr:sigma-70 family RNA polymerase sigma factor [Eggerthellaceae bacterium]